MVCRRNKTEELKSLEVEKLKIVQYDGKIVQYSLY
jgi:hypothetical protein